jgi:hypothetical protein
MTNGPEQPESDCPDDIHDDCTDDLLDERLYQQYCFACGRQNPIGLQMQFRRDGDDGVHCEYTPRPEGQGFPGVVHGGVLVSLMDEAMAWAMFAAHRAVGVTASPYPPTPGSPSAPASPASADVASRPKPPLRTPRVLASLKPPRSSSASRRIRNRP